MSNRYHSKYHRRNHHTYTNINIPDAGHDPIASQAEPFLGEFVLSGSLSAVAPLSSYAAHLYTKNTALCAIGDIEGAYITGGRNGIQVFSENLAISAHSPILGMTISSPVRAISAISNNIGIDVFSDNVGISAQGLNIGLEVSSISSAISAYSPFIAGEFYSNRFPISASHGNSVFHGKVGVNTSTPNEELTILGDISAIGYNNEYDVRLYLFDLPFRTINNSQNIFIGKDAGLSMPKPVLFSNENSKNNTFIGLSAGYNAIGGYHNIFLGSYAGYNNVNSIYNIFAGFQSGYSNQIGSSNVFLGPKAGYSQTAAYNNIAIGDNTLYSNLTGSRNVTLGFFAGYRNLESYNVYIGNDTSRNTIRGRFNVSIGHETNYRGISGDNNLFLGTHAGYSNLSGSNNIFEGEKSGYFHSTGNHNLFLGTSAGYFDLYGEYNTYLGYQAGYRNNIGTRNNFIGYQTGFSNTIGDYNNFFGNLAGYSNQSGQYNNFIGNESGKSNTIGNYNNFIGYRAGINNISGNQNNFIGTHVGFSNTTGIYNTFIGHQTGFSNTTGNYNVFLGVRTGYSNIEGERNNFIGEESGFSNTTGNHNNFIGYRSGYSNRIANYNNFFGHYSGYSNINGENNNYLGNASGYSNISGYSNNFIGLSAGYLNVGGYQNNFIGDKTGFLNISGGHNNFIGTESGYSNNNSSFNNFIGIRTGYSNISGEYNNFFGYYAGYSNISGQENIFIGKNSGIFNTIGSKNIFLGAESGNRNTTGNQNLFLGDFAGYFSNGSRNVFLGSQAGFVNFNGNDNNFIGNRSGYFNTTGSTNNFIGLSSGYFNTTGNLNNFLGAYAGRSNLNGVQNNFIGNEAGYSNTIGYENNFIGNRAGYSNINGYYNNFIGRDSGYSNTNGYSNNFIGNRAGYGNISGIHNNFIGEGSGASNTTGSSNNFIGLFTGQNNTTGFSNNFFGTGTGYHNTNGYYNNFLGNYAGFLNTTGNSNNFIGNSSGYSNTIGNDNLFIGNFSGYSNLSGNSNNFIGLRSGYSNITGRNNIFVGEQSGYSNTTGNNNIITGYAAGYSNTVANQNIFTGLSAGYSNIAGNDNIFIGNEAGYSSQNRTRNIFIGNKAGKFFDVVNNQASNANIVIGEEAALNTGTVFGFNFVGGYNALRSAISDGVITNNIILGPEAARNIRSSTNSIYLGLLTGQNVKSGFSNIFIGRETGKNIQQGLKNIFIGDNTATGFSNQTSIGGYINTIIGSDAGTRISNGHSNFIGGYLAGFNLNNTNQSIMIGSRAGYDNSSGSLNIYIGDYAGNSYLHGFSNISIGSNSSEYVNNGAYNIFIGNRTKAKNPNSSLSGVVVIGRDAEVSSDYELAIGSSTYPLTGTYYGNLMITGNLSALGTVTRLDTYVEVTSAVSITNIGTGPALFVEQSGTQPIAHFVDSDGDDIVFADNGNVGLGIYQPLYKLDARVQPSNNLEWIASFINPVNPNLKTQGAGIKLQLDNPNNLQLSDDKWAGIAAVAEENFSNKVGVAFYTQNNIGSGNGNSPTEKIRINSQGYLGILTNDPKDALTVNGNISSNGNIHLNHQRYLRLGGEEGTNDQARIQFIIDPLPDTGRLYIDTYDNGTEPIIFRQYNTNIPNQRLLIGTNGNVAIGQNLTSETPPHRLSVYGSGAFTGNFEITGNQFNKGDLRLLANKKLIFGMDSAGFPDIATSNVNDSGEIVFEYISDSNSRLIFNTVDNGNEPIVFRQSNSPRLTIGTDGNIGIRPPLTSIETFPAELTVYGDISAKGSLYIDTGENIDFIVNGNGNVGVNTSNPNEKLTVNGNISATGKLNNKWFDPLDFNYVSLRENFGTGGTTSGTIGQLGWNLTGTGTNIQNNLSNGFGKIGSLILSQDNIINANLNIGSLYLGNTPNFSGQSISTGTLNTQTIGIVRPDNLKHAWSLQYGRDGVNSIINFTKITAPKSFGVRYIPRSNVAWSTLSTTLYTVGSAVRPSTENGYKYITITEGSTYPTYPQPTWPTTIYSTVTAFPANRPSNTLVVTSNQYVRPTILNGYKYRSIAPNRTTGSVEPIWPTTIGNLVADTNITIWQANSAIVTNQTTRPSTVVSPYLQYRAVKNGTSHNIEPTWPTVTGSLVADTGISTWTASQNYAQNATVRHTTVNANGLSFVNQVAGTTTSHTVEPTWPTVAGSLVADTGIAVWSPSTVYSINTIRRSTVVTTLGRRFRVTTAGTSGSSEPVWNTTIGANTTDGTVTWICEAGLYPVWQSQDGNYPVWQSQTGTYVVWITEAADFPVFVCAGADGRADGKYEFYITGENAETNITTYPSTVDAISNKNIKVSIRWSSNIVYFSINDEIEISHSLGMTYDVYPSFNIRNDRNIANQQISFLGWGLYSDGYTLI